MQPSIGFIFTLKFLRAGVGAVSTAMPVALSNWYSPLNCRIVLRGEVIRRCDAELLNPAALSSSLAVRLDLNQVDYQSIAGERAFDVEWGRWFGLPPKSNALQILVGACGIGRPGVHDVAGEDVNARFVSGVIVSLKGGGIVIDRHAVWPERRQFAGQLPGNFLQCTGARAASTGAAAASPASHACHLFLRLRRHRLRSCR